MDTSTHSRLVSFIWSIADDCLRDVYQRGKYRDVILPMVVLRRLDVLLEPSKDKVLEEIEFQKKDLKVAEGDWDEGGLRDASGYVFYNTSDWTLQRLADTATNSQQILLANFEEYLCGFGPNVTEIIKRFDLARKISHMASKDVLLDVLEKFTSPHINLTPDEQVDPDGRKLPALTNLGMGYVFEELIRKFNEDNNEEAGQHFTPREVVELMTHIIFDPVKDNLPPVITIYDPACGSGGMLTESQNFITAPDGQIAATEASVILYGKEINDETYAICKSDMMIKGDNPANIRVGSTLSTDEFAGTTFDFMLSNPPYGKSWSSEVKYIKDGKDIIDSRFIVPLADHWGEVEDCDATPRSSDGQLLFLMEMATKMKPLSQSPHGSRIASVHNGSSLFTGDAGGGESNIRRYLFENDYVEAILQLPNNLFYNTGITTYVWILTNKKPDNRKGKVQLIDASGRFNKLRKNLGDKNCELSSDHIAEILAVHTQFTEVDRTLDDPDEALAAKVFDNEDFGYRKITVERPQRLRSGFSADRIAPLRFDKTLAEPMQWAHETYGERVYTDLPAIEKELLQWCEDHGLELNAKKRKTLTTPATWEKSLELLQIAEQLHTELGEEESSDFNEFKKTVDAALKNLDLKPGAAQKKAILSAVSWSDETAEKVLKKRLKLNPEKLATLCARLSCTEDQLADYGYHPSDKLGEFLLYEPDSDLRDTETIPLKDEIHAYFLREVRPHVEDAWIDLEKTKIGYEVSFNRHFYRHKPLRSLEDVTRDIIDLEKANDGLIAEILKM